MASCKKHPKHKQSPGVCSICLNDKLSKISSTSSLRKYNTRSSCSSSLSSISSISSDASPVPYQHYNDGRFSLGGKSAVMLMKSTSMAFEFDHRKRDIGSDHGLMKKDKKKTGFWSKLLRARTSKSIDHGLVRSRTTRERVNASTRVH
ncbi:uncharacterized protein LOC124910036 [Impatiens glandulifera]|uniref:uncharacterized protein LOC124910036 n=1 Tax=Impatiens glandulifera TaxID=253017 RepID=UPI001FB1A1DC|nr:uncharacterized protein LOC124910036 [Impatiens glandulifera]